jgi:hypothetical protein
MATLVICARDGGGVITGAGGSFEYEISTMALLLSKIEVLSVELVSKAKETFLKMEKCIHILLIYLFLTKRNDLYLPLSDVKSISLSSYVGGTVKNNASL